MHFRDRRPLVVALMMAMTLPGCGDARPPLLLPAALAQPDCDGANRVNPAEADDIVWKSCIHNGDHCSCAYDMKYKPPIVGVYACEGDDEFVAGLAATPKRLYAGFKNGVVEFAGKKVAAVLTGLTGDPIGLAVDQSGNVWATNANSATISEFDAGTTKPTANYTDPNLTSANYLAADLAGDIYVEGMAAYGIEVDVMPAGESTFSAIATQGEVGWTAGGLAVQNIGAKTYIWINDQGTASRPAAISRYLLSGSSLKAAGSFGYEGANAAIWADPAGKHPSRVFAVNNIEAGSEYASSAIEYSMPSGKIINSTATSTGATEAMGNAGAYK